MKRGILFFSFFVIFLNQASAYIPSLEATFQRISQKKYLVPPYQITSQLEFNNFSCVEELTVIDQQTQRARLNCGNQHYFFVSQTQIKSIFSNEEKKTWVRNPNVWNELFLSKTVRQWEETFLRWGVIALLTEGDDEISVKSSGLVRLRTPEKLVTKRVDPDARIFYEITSGHDSGNSLYVGETTSLLRHLKRKREGKENSLVEEIVVRKYFLNVAEIYPKEIYVYQDGNLFVKILVQAYKQMNPEKLDFSDAFTSSASELESLSSEDPPPTLVQFVKDYR